jgi:hypothetical protein
VRPAIVKSDYRKGLECSLLLPSVIIAPVLELHAASLNCTVPCSVESTEDESCALGLVSFLQGEQPRKSTVAILLI